MTDPSRFLEVASINYDFIPGQLESPKVLWVALKFPPPKDFRVDTLVRFHFKPGVGIETSPGSPSLNSTFYVNDIIGLRIFLMPSTRDWRPDLVGDPKSCRNFGWGYETRRMNVRPSRQDWLYGYGTPASFLEYHPVKYTDFPVVVT